MYGKTIIPVNLWGACLLTLFLILFRSPNFFICLPIVLYIPFIYNLFFINGNPNVLFWGLVVQWLSVSIQPFYCSIIGIPLNDLFIKSVFPNELMTYTAYLSIIGLYFFSYGLFLAIQKIKIKSATVYLDFYDPKSMLIIYVFISIIIYSSKILIWKFPGVVQYLFFLFYIKWGFFVVMFISIFKKAPTLKVYLYLIIAIEFVLGLSSFFANEFVNILLFSLIAYSSVSKKITYQRGILFFIFGLILFYFAVLWTASKKDYRSFLNQGQISQTVTVSKSEARKKLLELIGNLDNKIYKDAVEDLVNRVGYIQFFAAAMRYVPSKIPYEDGKVYWKAISHFLIPRFIDQDKEALDDSKHTNKYTGLGVSGKNRATSISLGSFADAYIDFGPILMFVPIFLFGLLIGTYYRVLHKNGIWGLILTAPFFLLVNIYGADTAKGFGFVTIYFVVIYFVNLILIQYLDPLMKSKPVKSNSWSS